MTRKCVTDEQYGQLSRRLGELLRRVDEGTIPFDRSFADAQLLVEGKTFQPHIIDCDANPYLPEGWKEVEYHKKGGMFEWDPTKVRLHLSPNQQNNKTIKGHNLRKELEQEPVLNANVLDYLLAHPEPIPEDWKEKLSFSGARFIAARVAACMSAVCTGVAVAGTGTATGLVTVGTPAVLLPARKPHKFDRIKNSANLPFAFARSQRVFIFQTAGV